MNEYHQWDVDALTDALAGALFALPADALREFKDRYSRGCCDSLALVLHEQLKLPLGLFGIVEEDDGETYDWPVHAFVYIDDDTVLDVDGVKTVGQLLEQQGDDTAWHRLATKPQVESAFTSDPANLEALIAVCRQDLIKVGWKPLLDAFAAKAINEESRAKHAFRSFGYG